MLGLRVSLRCFNLIELQKQHFSRLLVEWRNVDCYPESLAIAQNVIETISKVVFNTVT